MTGEVRGKRNKGKGQEKEGGKEETEEGTSTRREIERRGWSV